LLGNVTRPAVALAEWSRRKADRLDPARLPVVVLSEAHLRRVLVAHANYYNELRTHRSLTKDTPLHRAVERLGTVTSRPILGGLHHQYFRI
jgi:hypothetical protein